MDGMILFKGANLLWGLDREAKFKPVPKTNRVKVTRYYRRIRRGQDRMTAVRGGGISMIFQEPQTALNPIFSISDQVGEALLLHRGTEIIDSLLTAEPKGPAVEAAISEVVRAAKANNSDTLAKATAKLAEAAKFPSIATQAYYIFRLNWSDPESKIPELRHALARGHLTGLQRSYLKRERRRLELLGALRTVYMDEMRKSKDESGVRRRLNSRLSALRLSTFYFGLWGIRGSARRPLQQETFWRTVGLLEGVRIANPVQVARGYPHELSGGMLQRVMIAMALSAEPELLIADEPTTALDVTIQAQILELMRDLKNRIGTAILLITHDLGVIAEVSDRVCVMYAGNIVEVAPVRELYKRPLHPYTQGLLSSIPRMDEPDKKLESIPGSVPNLIYPPSGCRFHPRCPHAMPICKEARPPMTVEGEGHTVACYLYHGPVSKG
jgi:oligopeptide/dipeptide ABC transporter ATP-binding protein